MRIVDELKSLDSAEAFFRCLEVPYDPEALAPLRLHVLKRMGVALAECDLSALDEDDARARARASLVEAYREVVANGAMGGRLFKVLQDHDPARPAKARGRSFVPLSDLRAPR